MGQRFDLTKLIEWIIVDSSPEHLTELFEDIIFAYINYMLSDKEQGLPFTASDQHYYSHRLIKALKECKQVS